MAAPVDPQYLVTYGPDANCTLAICPASASVYEYRPSLGANITFLLLFLIALVIHTILGLKWRTFAFAFSMFWGCVSEVVGYGGRIMLWQDPFSFAGFLMQISESLFYKFGGRGLTSRQFALRLDRHSLVQLSTSPSQKCMSNPSLPVLSVGLYEKPLAHDQIHPADTKFLRAE